MGGGVFTYIVDLANELAEMYDMYVAYAIRPQTPINYTSYFDSRIHLIKVNNLTRRINAVSDLKAFFEIKEIAKYVKPDIIHLHSSKAGVLGRWAFNGHRIPLFYTPHGYSFLMNHYSFQKRVLFRFLEKISAKRYCTTISCSEGEHQETLHLTNRAVYVNNGVNIEQLRALVKECHTDISPEHKFTVFTLGRICNQKNPYLFNRIAEDMPDIDFLWIGDGDLKNVLTASNIEITGWTDRRTALKRSLMADIFFLPSLWEGLPLSLLEAMYLEKLCVVSNVIGNRDVIHNEENGFVCNTLEEYKRVIQEAKEVLETGSAHGTIKDNKKSERIKLMIAKGKADIQKKYNTRVMAKEYERIYKKVNSNDLSI